MPSSSLLTHIGDRTLLWVIANLEEFLCIGTSDGEQLSYFRATAEDKVNQSGSCLLQLDLGDRTLLCSDCQVYVKDYGFVDCDRLDIGDTLVSTINYKRILDIQAVEHPTTMFYGLRGRPYFVNGILVKNHG